MSYEDTPQSFRLALDGNEANTTQRVGSNVYAYEILQRLHAYSKRDQVSCQVLLSTQPVADLPKEHTYWRYQVITPSFLWTQWALPKYLYQHRSEIDLFFTPGHYAPRLSSVPYISSVMDLAFLEYPHQFRLKDRWQLKLWTKYSVQRAQHVITISKFSKSQIIKHYQLLPENITVAYPAVDQLTQSDQTRFAQLKKKFKLSSHYLIYIGTLQPRKNLVKLIAAFDKLHQTMQLTLSQSKVSRADQRLIKHQDLQLVIAGKQGWLAQPILNAVAQAQQLNRIILTDFVPDGDKQTLLQNSTGLVLVGEYEGFGIPALEAMHSNTVPIVSNSSSLPEVVGKAGVLVSPHNVSSIHDGIIELLSMTASQKARLKRVGRQQAKSFTWNASATLIWEKLLSTTNQTKHSASP